MQVINLDLSRKGAYPLVEAKQKDVGRKFQLNLSDAGISYSIPEGSVFTIWYSGPSGEGNYSSIDTKAAFSFEVNSNTVVIELVTQMLTTPGIGSMCVTIENSGKQIGLWNLRYVTECIPGAGSSVAKQHYTTLSNAVDRAEAAADRAEELAGLMDDAVQFKDLNSHDTSDIAHNDIRIALKGLSDQINAILNSDDATLAQISAVIAYVESNKTLIDAITTSKVSVVDIVNDLTTNLANRPLSAAQGVVLKTAIDTLWNAVGQIPGCYIVTATSSESGYVVDRTTSEISAALNKGSDVRLHDLQSGMYHHVTKADMLSASFYGLEIDLDGVVCAVAYFVSNNNTAIKHVIPIPSNADVLVAIEEAFTQLRDAFDELQNAVAQIPRCLIVNAMPTNSANEYTLSLAPLELCYAITQNYDIRLHDTATGFFHHLTWANVVNNMASAVFTGIEHGGENNMYAVAYYVTPDGVATKKTIQIS